MQMQALMLTLAVNKTLSVFTFNIKVSIKISTIIHFVNDNGHRHFNRVGSRPILSVKLP